MCCHLVSFSEGCLASLLNTRPMETSATPDSHRSKYYCACRNKTGQKCNRPTYHLHIILRFLFIKYICSDIECPIIHTESFPWIRQVLLTPSPFHPSSSSVQVSNSPQATQMLLIFTASSLCLFYEAFGRMGLLFGFRKEKAGWLPKMIRGWETMAHPVWFSLLFEPQTSSLL